MQKKQWSIAIGLCGVIVITIFLAVFLWDEYVQEPSVLFVSSTEARIKINEHQDALILDVRSNAEFISLRIPGSVNIPYTSISHMQNLLPEDRHTLIFVYCRTGRRAGIAANELVGLGYTNIIVFPGMASWDGETITG